MCPLKTRAGWAGRQMYAFKDMRHFSKLCSWCSHLAVQSPHSNSLHHTVQDTLCSHLSGSYLQKESDQDLLPTFLHKHKSLGLSSELQCPSHEDASTTRSSWITWGCDGSDSSGASRESSFHFSKAATNRKSSPGPGPEKSFLIRNQAFQTLACFW